MTTPPDLIAKLKIPPKCFWFRNFGDAKTGIAFGRPDADPGCLDALSILDEFEREQAACVALQYWRIEYEKHLMDYHAIEREFISRQIDCWTEFGGLDK